MAHSVSVWESDPKAFKYNCCRLFANFTRSYARRCCFNSYEQQKAIGYDSEFIEGEADCMKYMKRYVW